MKPLFRTVFVWLALLAPVFGQAQPIESYVLNLPPGLSLIANQLDNGGNTLNEIMPVVPDGSIISFWNPALAKYDPIATYSALTGWSDGNLILAPGKGALFENKSNATFPLTFTGTRRLVVPTPPELSIGGQQLMSMPIPRAGDLNELQFPVPCGLLQVSKLVGGDHYEVYFYDPDSGGWNPMTPTMNVGEAFFIDNMSPCPGGPPFVLVCSPSKSVSCGTDWTFDAPTVQGACDGQPVVNVVNTVTNGSCPMQITRIYEATDNCGNRATCTQTVTVTDDVPPQLVCAPDKSVECGSDWSFDPPTATDTCSEVTINVLSTVTNGTCPVVISRTYEATDACGNRSTCTQAITIADTIPPQLVCAPDKSVECGSDWSFEPPTATDSCSEVTINIASTVTNGTCPATIVRTYEAVDACGNRATCSQTVSISSPAKGDLYVKDTPYNYNGAPDLGREPDPNMASQSMWMSRDIWVHQVWGQPAETYLTHQNPRYGQTNAILVNVSNRGQVVVPGAKLKVYVANASLGLSWPSGWTLIDTYDLPGIEPGASHIAQVAWKLAGTGHYCLLARIVSEDDPMTTVETSNISANVRANNNLAWRNVNVVNLTLTTGQSAEVRVKPVHNKPRPEVKTPGEKPPRQPVTVQCKTEAIFHEGAGEATLHLGPWFKRWQDAGGRGQGFEHIGDNAIRCTNTLVRLEDIPMDDDEEAIINLVVKAPHPMPIAGTEHTCHVELTEEIDGEAVGGVNYGVLVRALHTDTDHDGIVDVDDPDDDGDGVSDVHDPDPLGEPDCPPSALTIRYVDGDMVVSWNGLGYRLETSAKFNGPWRPLPHAVSPRIVAPTEAEQFFRLVCH